MQAVLQRLFANTRWRSPAPSYVMAALTGIATGINRTFMHAHWLVWTGIFLMASTLFLCMISTNDLDRRGSRLMWGGLIAVAGVFAGAAAAPFMTAP